MNLRSTAHLMFVAIGLLALGDVHFVHGNCQLETVKMHAYHACDYIGEQLYQDHLLDHTRTRRHSAHHDHAVADVADDHSASATATARATGDGSETTHEHHHFKRRYQRPTHLSIRHLTDGYLVTDYAYAHILRRHPSHRYKIMPTHYHNNNGTLERVPTHSEPHHYTRRANHHHHPKATADATASTAASDGEMENDVLLSVTRAKRTHRRQRRNANVAVSSCCRDIERCMHLICPLS